MSFSDTIVDRRFDDAAFERHPSFNTWQNRFEGTLANLQTLHLTKVELPWRFLVRPSLPRTSNALYYTEYSFSHISSLLLYVT